MSATLMAVLVAGGCRRNPAFDKTMARLQQKPEEWEPALRELEQRLIADNDKSKYLRIAQLRTSAASIVTDEPDCRPWVNEYVYSAVGAISRGLRVAPLSPICPVVPQTYDSHISTEIVLHVFPDDFSVGRFSASFDGPSNSSFVTGIAGTRLTVTIPTPEQHISAIVLKYVSSPAGGAPLTWRIGVEKKVRDKVCVAQAEADYSHQISQCKNKCCDVKAESCAEYCAAECERRKAENPAGHPAIGDACSTGGAFYQWCHQQFCENIVSCQQAWCSPGEERTACLNLKAATRDSIIAKCPLVEEGE